MAELTSQLGSQTISRGLNGTWQWAWQLSPCVPEPAVGVPARRPTVSVPALLATVSGPAILAAVLEPESMVAAA